MTTAIHRCERAGRCYASERDPANLQVVHLVGAATDRQLCDLCEQAVERVLNQAPWLYRDLRDHTLRTSSAARSEMVTTSRGNPLPLNASALHLAEQLHQLLTRWEDEVRTAAGLTDAVRTGRREGRQVMDAATVLAGRLRVWLGLPSTAFAVSRQEPEIDQSGVEAAVELLEWRSQVRNLPGLDRDAKQAVKRYRDFRCPACGIRGTVTHRAGDDLMQCQNCQATHEYLPTLPPEADYRLDDEAA